MTDAKPKKLKLTPPRRKVALPLGPYLDVARVITAAGLQVIELLAANGAPQTKIAATLGLPLTTFKKRVNDKDIDNRERLAWERGRGALEYELATALLEQSRNGNVIATLFYLKNMGWSDTPAPTQQVGIQIVVPDSLSREQWSSRSLPQVKVIEQIAPPVETVSQPATPIEPEVFTPEGYIEP